jgi:hypothetical protein
MDESLSLLIAGCVSPCPKGHSGAVAAIAALLGRPRRNSQYDQLKGQIPRQRLLNGPIDTPEEVRFDVVWSGGAGMRRPADGNADRIEPASLITRK